MFVNQSRRAKSIIKVTSFDIKKKKRRRVLLFIPEDEDNIRKKIKCIRDMRPYSWDHVNSFAVQTIGQSTRMVYECFEDFGEERCNNNNIVIF